MACQTAGRTCRPPYDPVGCCFVVAVTWSWIADPPGVHDADECARSRQIQVIAWLLIAGSMAWFGFSTLFANGMALRSASTLTAALASIGLPAVIVLTRSRMHELAGHLLVGQMMAYGWVFFWNVPRGG